MACQALATLTTPYHVRYSTSSQEASSSSGRSAKKLVRVCEAFCCCKLRIWCINLALNVISIITTISRVLILMIVLLGMWSLSFSYVLYIAPTTQPQCIYGIHGVLLQMIIMIACDNILDNAYKITTLMNAEIIPFTTVLKLYNSVRFNNYTIYTVKTGVLK